MLSLVASYRDDLGWWEILWEDLISFAEPEELEKYTFYWECPTCGHPNRIEDIASRRAEMCDSCNYTMYGYDYVQFQELLT